MHHKQPAKPQRLHNTLLIRIDHTHTHHESTPLFPASLATNRTANSSCIQREKLTHVAQLPTPIPPTTTPAPSAHQDPHKRARMQIINQLHKKTGITRPPTMQSKTDTTENRSRFAHEPVTGSTRTGHEKHTRPTPNSKMYAQAT